MEHHLFVKEDMVIQGAKVFDFHDDSRDKVFGLSVPSGMYTLPEMPPEQCCRHLPQEQLQEQRSPPRRVNLGRDPPSPAIKSSMVAEQKKPKCWTAAPWAFAG